MTNRFGFDAFRQISKKLFFQSKKLKSSLNTKTNSNQVIIITGATAVGKSAVAKKLAKIYDSEIVLADSVQIYKHLNIGSNKPTTEDINETKHHLIDICDVNDNFNSGEYVRKASELILDILSRNKTPIIVGGVTMWIQWLIQGIPDNPKSNEQISKDVQAMISPYENRKAWDEAIENFLQYDKKVLSLNRNDWYRLSRSVEIAIHKTKYPNGQLAKERLNILDEVDFRCYFISEDRESLYRVIDQRCYDMIKIGLFDEVYNLVTKYNLLPQSMGCKAIGYRQTLEYFCRDNFKPNDIDAFKNYLLSFAAATRNYAKRQIHWYRQDKHFLFLRIDRNNSNISFIDNIVNEIIYWNNVNRNNYIQMIDIQINQSNEINNIRKQSKSQIAVLINDLPINERFVEWNVQQQALYYLINSNEINYQSDELMNINIQSNSNSYSAYDFLIRTSEGKVGSKKLLEYISEFQDNKRYDKLFPPYIEKADKYITLLKLNHNDKYQLFHYWLIEKKHSSVRDID